MQSPHVRARGDCHSGGVVRFSRNSRSKSHFRLYFVASVRPPHSAIAWRNFSVARVTWKRRNRRPDTARSAFIGYCRTRLNPWRLMGLEGILWSGDENRTRVLSLEADVHAIRLERTVSPGDGFVVIKNIGFLSFGHWAPSPRSRTRSASDALLQSIDLAIAARSLVPTARISGFITSPTSFRRRSRCLPPLVQGPAGSKSAPP